jgi:PAS domain S-box-containing protein
MTLRSWICMSLSVWVLSALGLEAAEPKRILLIHSFGRDFAPFNSISGILRTELVRQSPEPVDIVEASLDSARFPDRPHEDLLVDYLRAEFADHRLDLVLPIGGPAVQFAQRQRQRLFPGAPMLIAATDQRHVQQAVLTTNDTAVAVAHDLTGTMENILRVLPGTTHVVIVIGDSPLERFWAGELQRSLQPYASRVALVWFNTLPFAEILKRCATLPPHSAIFYALMSVDAAGVPHTEQLALARLHQSANAPLFGVFDTELGQGIVGGPLLGIEQLSRKTATVALRILAGENPSTIQTPPQGPGTPQYDWRELQRWGIDESRLPPGSQVLFRQPGFWQLYRGRILAAAGVCLGEGVLIMLLVRSLAKRRRAERALRESEERFRLLVDQAPEAVFVYDADIDTVVQTNPQAERLFGCSREQLLAGPLQRFYHPEQPDGQPIAHTFRVHTDRALSGETVVFERAISDAQGERHDCEVRLVRLPAGKRRLVRASFVDITQRKRAEQAAHELSGRLIRAQEEERARLAQELHDGLSQNLALLAVEMEMCHQRLPAPPDRIHLELLDLATRTRGLSAEVHRISHGLHPAKLTQLGLTIALQSYCREVEAAHNLTLQFTARQVPRELPEDVALCLYRVAQEAIQNVVKHSGAHHAIVELSAREAVLALTVRDEGKGFESGTEARNGSLGLVSMAERVRLVGGEFAVESKPGLGTRINVRVPFQALNAVGRSED